MSDPFDLVDDDAACTVRDPLEFLQGLSAEGGELIDTLDEVAAEAVSSWLPAAASAVTLGPPPGQPLDLDGAPKGPVCKKSIGGLQDPLASAAGWGGIHGDSDDLSQMEPRKYKKKKKKKKTATHGNPRQPQFP